MAEVVVKVDVPNKLEKKFGNAIEKVLNKFIKQLEFEVADDILNKSKMTDESALKLGRELKERVTKRHGLSLR